MRISVLNLINGDMISTEEIDNLEEYDEALRVLSKPSMFGVPTHFQVIPEHYRAIFYTGNFRWATDHLSLEEAQDAVEEIAAMTGCDWWIIDDTTGEYIAESV